VYDYFKFKLITDYLKVRYKPKDTSKYIVQKTGKGSSKVLECLFTTGNRVLSSVFVLFIYAVIVYKSIE